MPSFSVCAFPIITTRAFFTFTGCVCGDISRCSKLLSTVIMRKIIEWRLSFIWYLTCSDPAISENTKVKIGGGRARIVYIEVVPHAWYPWQGWGCPSGSPKIGKCHGRTGTLVKRGNHWSLFVNVLLCNPYRPQPWS